MSENSFVHPKHCFCQVPDNKLKKWAIKRFKDNISTIELLNQTDSDEEKEIISIVSLLDVDKEKLIEMFTKDMSLYQTLLYLEEKERSAEELTKLLGIDEEQVMGVVETLKKKNMWSGELIAKT